jgi:hypothetical protein
MIRRALFDWDSPRLRKIQFAIGLDTAGTLLVRLALGWHAAYAVQWRVVPAAVAWASTAVDDTTSEQH